MKSLEQLIDTSESTWLTIQEWVSKAANHVELAAVNRHAADEVLHHLQITTKSVLGTVAYYTGGIVVEHGWLRLLGSGSNRLPRSLSSWNGISASGQCTRFPSALLVADDVLGGFFAINGGAFQGEPGEIFYLAPDTLEWEGLEIQYSDFLNWACCGDVKQFYESFYWDDWVEEIKNVDGEQGVHIYPFLWAAGDTITNRSRSIVPIEELWNLHSKIRG